jgi:hypothetical protein
MRFFGAMFEKAGIPYPGLERNTIERLGAKNYRIHALVGCCSGFRHDEIPQRQTTKWRWQIEVIFLYFG